MDKNQYRSLTPNEIEQLIRQNCQSEDWSQILVADHFDPKRFMSVQFSGTIKIGIQDGDIELYGGVKKHCGVYNAHLHNCEIGSNVYINHIKNYIANYVLEDHVVIDNTDICAVEAQSRFGNGTRIEVLDETGGRTVVIYDALSAHLAYIMAFYKHRHDAICKLEAMIDIYCQQVQSNRGIIGKHTRIFNCKELRNVKTGPYTKINGASSLKNGSINSTQSAPVVIGHDVKLKNFIVSSGTEITDGAIIANCFIGQGCSIGAQYSAQNSLFFANCQGFHGEACAVFAGPYTVTHHKSTLLIAGMFSFCNAGSGSNQSNHMYKLGPIHHGIVERGSKTTSDSYLLWPAKIGAFTLVMGRHYKNSDTSDMPFSYLIEKNDESWLVPGVNLRSVGTIRDVLKWPKRDKRTDEHQLDFVNFNLLSPFTIQKMARAIEILHQIQHISGETTEVFSYNNTKIKRDALLKGLKLYDMAIMKFIGNSIITRLNKAQLDEKDNMAGCLKQDSEIGTGDWIDLAGLIAPKNEITKLLEGIENKDINDLKAVDRFFRTLHQNYYEYEWNWTVQFIESYLQKPVAGLSRDELIEVIGKWRQSVVELDQMLYEDAKKEFRLDSMTGFGIDGDMEIKQKDFEQVRGRFEENDFVKEVLHHIDRKTKLGERVINQLKITIKN
jgi:NDP-sugar pyrophosphorylase family protein